MMFSLSVQFSSVQFSHSVLSDSLWPHVLQHARLPCPSPTPELAQTHVHRVSDASQPSHSLSSSSLPAFNLSQHQDLFPLLWNTVNITTFKFQKGLLLHFVKISHDHTVVNLIKSECCIWVFFASKLKILYMQNVLHQ